MYYIYMYINIYMYIGLYTVNVVIFARYIFSLISRRALDVQTFDVSEK